MRCRTAFVVIAVLLAGAAGSAAASPSPAPRPGDAIAVDGTEGGCTLGFLFAGSDGATYASTAGHCVLGNSEIRKTWPKGKGPAVSVSDGSEGAGQFGRVVFAQFLPTDDNDWLDFALIRLDAGVRASSTVREIGGPTGVYTARDDRPVAMQFYGQGTGASAVDPSRELLAPNTSRATHVYAHGAATPGDSGAPVLTAAGEAVGLVLGAGGNAVGVGLGTASVGHDAAPNRIVRLQPVLDHAVGALRVRLRLLQS